MELRVIDFETTGIPDDENEHSVCEAAYVDVDADGNHTDYQTLVKPTTEMSIEARAVHHISDDEIAANGMDWVDVCCDLAEGDNVVYVAHNADFEKEFFNPKGSNWIDTWKCALKLYPNAPRHTNQVLKYFLEIDDCEEHHPPHRALPDCYVTAEILVKMLGKVSVEDMIRVSNEPPYLTKIGFGKHRGKKFKDLPPSYLDWLSTQDMDEGVMAAVKRVRGQ